MALFLTLGFLAREVFPPGHRHIDVRGLDLDGVDDPPLLLAGDDRGARPDEAYNVGVTPRPGLCPTSSQPEAA